MQCHEGSASPAASWQGMCAIASTPSMQYGQPATRADMLLATAAGASWHRISCQALSQLRGCGSPLLQAQCVALQRAASCWDPAWALSLGGLWALSSVFDC